MFSPTIQARVEEADVIRFMGLERVILVNTTILAPSARTDPDGLPQRDRDTSEAHGCRGVPKMRRASALRSIIR
jgi:hypothetical protein